MRQAKQSDVSNIVRRRRIFLLCHALSFWPLRSPFVWRSVLAVFFLAVVVCSTSLLPFRCSPCFRQVGWLFRPRSCQYCIFLPSAKIRDEHLFVIISIILFFYLHLCSRILPSLVKAAATARETLEEMISCATLWEHRGLWPLTLWGRFNLSNTELCRECEDILFGRPTHGGESSSASRCSEIIVTVQMQQTSASTNLLELNCSPDQNLQDNTFFLCARCYILQWFGDGDGNSV